MAEHYTKNTVSVSAMCRKCNKFTDHRVDSGRKGPCMVCLQTAPIEKKPQPEPSTQGSLF